MSKRMALIVNTIGTLQLFLAGSAAFFGYTLWQGYTDTAVIFFTIFILVMGTVGILKLAFRTARPDGAHIPSATYAFPSGHSAAASFLAVYGGYMFFKHLDTLVAVVLTAVVTLIVVLISASRITLQVHTNTQIIAGILIGVAMPAVILMNQMLVLEYIYRIIPL